MSIQARRLAESPVLTGGVPPVQQVAAPLPPSDDERLRARLSELHLRQRLSMESAHGKAVFGYGRTFFHIENWYSIHAVIRGTLRLMGIYDRGQRNARALKVVHNPVTLPALPAAFSGLRLLHLSDLHLDGDPEYLHTLCERVQEVDADLTVITGDFRYRTHGDWRPAMAALERLRRLLPGDVYAILGNHDTVRMVPTIEDFGIRLLLNEHVVLERGADRLYLAGIDDPHYFCTDNIERAAENVPLDACAILLAHSPEAYWQAAHSGFDLLLAGHTHGGQLCLPGGFALMTNADCPRSFCRGPFRYCDMQGYTSAGTGSSIVSVRFNCPPELVVHELRRPQ